MAVNEIGWSSVTFDNEGHDLRLSATIKNFLDYVCKPNENLKTLKMECSRRCGAKWTLQIYPFGKSEARKEEIGVYLSLIHKPRHAEMMTATYKFYILGKDGQKLKITGPCNGEEDNLKLGYGYNMITTRSEIQKDQALYLPNGHLTVRCEGKAFLGKPHQFLEVENLPPTILSNHYPELVKKMYEESICCDVVLKTGSSEFKCHKAILSATSNYFKAMFGHDMKENRENEVDLSKDLKEPELKALLDYIYVAKPDFAHLSPASIQNLYRVSDMYEIDGLREACEAALIKNLNQDNAEDIVVLGIEHRAKRLKKAAATTIAIGQD